MGEGNIIILHPGSNQVALKGEQHAALINKSNHTCQVNSTWLAPARKVFPTSSPAYFNCTAYCITYRCMTFISDKKQVQSVYFTCSIRLNWSTISHCDIVFTPDTLYIVLIYCICAHTAMLATQLTTPNKWMLLYSCPLQIDIWLYQSTSTTKQPYWHYRLSLVATPLLSRSRVFTGTFT